MSTACPSSDRADIEDLRRAVLELRAAPNEAKHAILPRVVAVPCSAPAVCDAKAACVSFGEGVAAAMAKKRDVEQALAEIQAGRLAKDSDRARALPAALDESSALLAKAEESLARCDSALLRLRR